MEEMAQATRKLQSPVKTFPWESEEREEGREGEREMKIAKKKKGLEDTKQLSLSEETKDIVSLASQ